MDTQNKLTRVLFWGSFVIGLAVFALSLFFVIEYEGEGWDHWYAFAASLGASAIWWALLARFAEKEILALVRSRLEEERLAAEETRQMEVDLLKAELERFSLGDELPAAIYDGKLRWDLRFNRDLSAHLDATTTYVFRGPTGVFVGARLSHRDAVRPLALVQVTITDPMSKPAMQLAVRDRRKRPAHVDKDPALVETELRDDIFMAVIGLFDARAKAKTVQIVHDRRATRVRAELFDAALYDATVDTLEPKNFPNTLRWDDDQSTYKVREETLRLRGDVRRMITLRRETTEDELRAHLVGLGMDPGRLEELRERYRRIYVITLGRVLERASEYSDEWEDDE